MVLTMAVDEKLLFRLCLPQSRPAAVGKVRQPGVGVITRDLIDGLAICIIETTSSGQTPATISSI